MAPLVVIPINDVVVALVAKQQANTLLNTVQRIVLSESHTLNDIILIIDKNVKSKVSKTMLIILSAIVNKKNDGLKSILSVCALSNKKVS